MKNYELIEHTADIGIKVKGSDLKMLFENAALAVFDIIAENKSSGAQDKHEIIIKLKADDTEELLVSWLNELLSLSATRELIFSGFKVKKITPKTLQAAATGEAAENYRLNTEIKAATYHQLKIEQADGGWQAQVIFDV